MSSLGNACAPVAVAMAKVLSGYYVENRVLRFRCKGEQEGHVVVIFVHNKILRAYDSAGSLTLSKGLTMKDSPKKIAEAFLKAERSKKTLASAFWY